MANIKQVLRFLGAAALISLSAYGQAAVITFDDIQGGIGYSSPNPVSNQYAALGVTFSDLAGTVGAVTGASLNLSGFSGNNVLFATQHQSNDSGDLRINFLSGTNSVAFDAFLSASYYLSAFAYASNGSLINSYTFNGSPNYGVGFHNSISTGTSISYLLLTSHPNGTPNNYGNFSIDNLNVSAVPEPETYAMLLAGLGVIAASVKRRKAKQA